MRHQHDAKFSCPIFRKNLTSNAGLVHLGRFIGKLGLSQALEDGLSIERGANAKYSVADTGCGMRYLKESVVKKMVCQNHP
jgi:hypothetical protein